MATLAVKVGVDVTGTDALRGLGQDLGRVGRNLTTAITLPIIGAGAAITKVAVDFDTALRRIVGLTDVTAEEIEGIREAILSLSGVVGKTPQELAEAFYFLASAGLTTQQALESLGPAAKASAAGMGATADIARILGGAINAYGAENITAAQAADILTAAVGKGSAEAADFAQVLGPVIPIAANLGVSFDQVAAAVAGMTTVSIDADTAAVGLKNILTSILNPTTEAKTQLLALGTSAGALREQLREKGLLVTLRDLEERFRGNEEAIGKVFGDVRGLVGVTALLGLTEEKLNDIFGATVNSLGALDVAYRDTEGPARDFERAIADVQATLIEIGTIVIPLVLQLLHGLRDGLAELRAWWASLDEATKSSIITFTGLAAVLGPVLIILGLLASGLAVLLSPIGLVIAAVAALGIAWATNFNGIQTKVAQAVAVIGPILQSIANVLLPAIGIAASTLGLLLGNVWSGITSGVIRLGSVISIVFEGIGTVLTTAQGIARAVGTGVAAAFATMGSVISGIMGKLGSTIRGGFNVIIRAANTFIRAWNGISLGGFSIPNPLGGELFTVPRVGTPNIATIPYLHEGGIVPGIPGTDVLTLLEAGEHVTARDEVGGGGIQIGTIQVTVDARGRESPHDIGQAVADSVAIMLREQQARVGI
jgi:TP901 family phage tail tape measure protein